MRCLKYVIGFVLSLMPSLCHAAVTVEDAYAYAELVNLEFECSAPQSNFSLSSTLTVPTGAGDDEHLLVNGSTTVKTSGTYSITGPDAGTTFTHIGAWLAISNPDIVVDTDVEFFWFGPSGNRDIGLKLGSDGTGTMHTFSILRASGSSWSNNNDVFEDDTWYWLDIFYKRHDSTGEAYVYLTPEGDDSRNLIDSISSTDFNDGTGGGHSIVYAAQVDASYPFAGESAFHWKNVIIEYGITSVPSEGQFRVASLMSAAYQSGTTSDTGDNLTSGDWVDTIDSSSATKGVFAPTDGGGIVADSATGNGIIGPKDQFGDAAVALGAKWAGQFRETGVGGVGIYYGKYDGSTYTAIADTSGCTGVFFDSYFEAAGGTYIPDIADEWFVVGANNDNFIIGDMWARELRTFMFSSFPYDASLSSGVGRAEFRAQGRAKRTN